MWVKKNQTAARRVIRATLGLLIVGQLLIACTAALTPNTLATPTVSLTPSLLSASQLPAKDDPKNQNGDTANSEKVAMLPNFLSTTGRKLVDATGKEVLLTGINWFGMETGTYAPHGIWARNWQEMMDQIVALGFNTIRLPFSSEALDPKAVPTEGIDFDYNPDLQGLNGLQIMDKVVQGARDRGLKVILDRHRISKDGQSKLWYNDKYSEDRWIADWAMLAKRYQGNDAVIGADLHNEPAGEATWGSGDLKTDWRLAAERAGNAILAANPDWLIIVEGVEKFDKDWYWMGGNLSRAREYPVRLNVPNKLVYSAHDYGPGVFMQGWFQDKSFPTNLPKIWDQHWGYLAKEDIAPVLIGEFGGHSVGTDLEGQWQNRLLEYLKQNGISYTYWSLNPNSADTGGLLKDDWFSIDKAKQTMLSTYQFPLLGQAKVPRKPEAAEPKPYVMPVGPAGLTVAFKPGDPKATGSGKELEFKITNRSDTSYSLKDIELRYWFKSEPADGQGHTAQVNWADIQNGNILPSFVEGQSGTQGYMKIDFTDGQLGGKGGTINLKVQFKVASGGQHSFQDDWSFRPFLMMKDWDQIGIYLKGALAWGKAPG